MSTPPISPYNWVANGFSFLSGLPPKARNRRVIMPIQVYVDESGDKPEPFFVMFGLLAKAEQWMDFSAEWSDCLGRSPTVKGAFKMKAFVRRKPPQRDEKLAELVDIVARYCSGALATVVDLKAHAETWEAAMPKPMRSHYLPAFIGTFTNVVTTCYQSGEKDRFELIFDQHDIYSGNARRAYACYREMLKIRDPDTLYPLLPVEPLFRPDEEFMPLQAADLFAWCLRNSFVNPTDKRFNWVLPALESRGLSIDFDWWDRPRLENRTIGILQRVMASTDEDLERANKLREKWFSA